jgi:starch phosphorylase
MEYSLPDQEIPFAGGLGVLAGDFLLEAGTQSEVDFTALGLFYMPNPYNPEELSWEKINFFPIVISNQQYFVTAWQKQFGSAKIVLFATDDGITHHPYGPDRETMIKQQILLAQATDQLNIISNDSVVHLNEGHTGFVPVPLQKRGLKPKIVCTKHTILHEAGLFLKREELDGFEEIFNVGTDEKHPTDFSTTKFMIANSQKGNAVSSSHARFEKIAHPNSPLISITNGVNLDRWKAKNIETLGLIDAHAQNKQFMTDYLNKEIGSTLDSDILTIVWARRLATYKQPELILTNLEKLGQLGNMGVQFIISGPVNPADPSSLSLASKFTDAARKIPYLAFLPRHNIETASILTKGADVWLNTPIIGKEACGTSGMKAGLNGALQFSTNDGWIAEEDWSELGWILPDENAAESLYRQITDLIAPMYYQNKGEWESRMTKTSALCVNKYSTKRMWNEYKEKLYLP